MIVKIVGRTPEDRNGIDVGNIGRKHSQDEGPRCETVQPRPRQHHSRQSMRKVVHLPGVLLQESFGDEQCKRVLNDAEPRRKPARKLTVDLHIDTGIRRTFDFKRVRP